MYPCYIPVIRSSGVRSQFSKPLHLPANRESLSTINPSAVRETCLILRSSSPRNPTLPAPSRTYVVEMGGRESGSLARMWSSSDGAAFNCSTLWAHGEPQKAPRSATFNPRHTLITPSGTEIRGRSKRPNARWMDPKRPLNFCFGCGKWPELIVWICHWMIKRGNSVKSLSFCGRLNSKLTKFHETRLWCDHVSLRTPSSTTHGRVSVQRTDGRGTSGSIWTTCTRAKSRSTAYCPTHTRRPRWVESTHTQTHTHAQSYSAPGLVWCVSCSSEGGTFLWFPFLWTPPETNYHRDWW